MVMHFNTTCLWSLLLLCSQPIEFLKDITSRAFTPWWIKVELVACQMAHCPCANAPCWIMWTKHVLVICYFLKKIHPIFVLCICYRLVNFFYIAISYDRHSISCISCDMHIFFLSFHLMGVVTLTWATTNVTSV